MPKTDYNDTWKSLSQIHEGILGSNDNVSLHFVRERATMWPRWYMEMLTRIFAITRGNELIYITSTLTAHEKPHGEVYAFTEHLVIHAAVTHDTESRQDTVATEAWSRSELQEIAVHEVEPYAVLEPAHQVDFPTYLRLQLRYRDRDEVALPLVQSPGPRGFAAIADAYYGFVEDLTRARVT